MNNEDSKDLKKIVERIQKLLNMAADTSSEHEAAIAAARAKKLMDKYNLSMADVIARDLHDDSNVVENDLTDITYAKKYPLWISSLACRVSKLFDCEVKIGWKSYDEEDGKLWHRQLKIYGYASDVEIAKYVFIFLFTTATSMADTAWRDLPQYKKDMTSATSWKRQYCLGIINGVDEKLKKLYQSTEIVSSTGQSLVVLKTEAIVRKFGVFEYNNVDSDVGFGYSEGYRDAEKIQLSKGVEDTELERITA